MTDLNPIKFIITLNLDVLHILIKDKGYQIESKYKTSIISSAGKFNLNI